ncbi:MAG: general secretion pathway protein GspK [Pseudomonadales bacterium]|nr:MAG: general secretion pathway protein GspK [Pseudomonadales bacterium]
MQFFQHQKTSSKKSLTISLASHQRGVALLVVLLLVVMIVVLAGSMLASKEITTRKSQLIFEQDSFRQQIQAAEQMAVELIRTDSNLNDADSLQDVWAKGIEPYSTEDGYLIELAINDASARFNLNNLYHDGAVDEQALASFRRLLESLGLDPNLATVVLDWQDPDTLVYNDGGAEATVYQSTGQLAQATAKKNGVGSTQPANQPFISIDQLAQLPNVTAETIATLRPYVTAVPYWLPINVNTADAVVLTAMVGSENSGAVQTLLTSRVNQPIESDGALQALGLFNNSLDNADDGNADSNTNEGRDSNKEQESTTGQGASEQDGNKNEKSSNEKSSTEKNDKQQKPCKKCQEKEKKQQLDKLLQSLSYQSRAFEVLISVSKDQTLANDSSKSRKKTRYATLFIAKGKSLPSAYQQQASMNRESDDKPSIQAFAQRIWAFRPPFIEH